MTAFEVIRVVDSNPACSWAAGRDETHTPLCGAQLPVADLGFPVAQCIRLVTPLCESTCHQRGLRCRMPSSEGSHPATSTAIDQAAQPQWLRTGYKFFPYAARQSGQWWVLRLNHGFPEHEMYTLFVDGKPAVDVTGSPEHSSALVRSIASLRPYDVAAGEPILDADTAACVVKAVAGLVNYGSEHDDPCMFCSDDRDRMARL